jgi:glucose 1-dehydrogenase
VTAGPLARSRVFQRFKQRSSKQEKTEGIMRLENKIALITGSSQGIGRGIALRFAQEGADVVINYNRTAQGAEEALREVEATGRRGLIVQADLGKVADIRRLIGTAVEHFGRLDILVNNAGLETHAPFWEVSESDFDKVLNVNLKGVFFATQEFVRHLMTTQRRGKIVNISSVHEELPFPNFTAYCASKGGLKMLTRNLSVELGALGININNIAPGAIETPINTKLLNDPQKLGALLAQIPLGRLGQPGDVSGLAVFLASRDADYVTGATYYVDGGLTWHYEEQ